MTEAAIRTTIATLANKYAKLVGELELIERTIGAEVGVSAILEAIADVDRRKVEINETLAHIETVIWLFDEGWNPAAIAPKYSRPRRYPQGTISTAALNVLKGATVPMTTRQIAREVASILDVGADRSAFLKVEKAIVAFLKARLGNPIQAHEGPPRRWSLRLPERSAAVISPAGAAANIRASRARKAA